MREEGRKGNGRGKWKKEKGRRGVGEKRGSVLPDQCQTTSYAPVSDCMGRPITYSYAHVDLPVGTVIFDTNNHETN